MDTRGKEIKQVGREAYDFFRYCGIDRWASYHYQLTEIISVKPASVLEVGVGDGVICGYLSRNTEIEYSSVDIADDVGADFIGSITALPFENKSFEMPAFNSCSILNCAASTMPKLELTVCPCIVN